VFFDSSKLPWRRHPSKAEPRTLLDAHPRQQRPLTNAINVIEQYTYHSNFIYFCFLVFFCTNPPLSLLIARFCFLSEQEKKQLLLQELS